MQVRVFGGVAACDDAGEPLDVGPAKCQLVLAALAVEAGHPVPVSRLVELVWGEEAPRTAERTLQSYVARIRRGLGADAIVRSGAAYRLDVDPDAVDVCRFERALADGDVASALDEWCGPPLAGLDAEGLAPVVDRLTESWLAATERAIAGELDADPASVVGRLTELTARHPYREELWALLMTALYRSGRQADALAAYGRAREVLVEQLGIEPGAALRELEARILRQDEDLAASPASPSGHGELTPAPQPAPSPEPTPPLPRAVPRLIGRDRERAAVVAAIEDHPLVTLTGPGGVGKTTLAVSVAHDVVGAGRPVRFVDLSGVAEDGDVARVVADGIGAADAGERDPTALVTVELTRLGAALLVLDNGEQVVDGVADLVSTVLARCPAAGVVLTSREPLELSDERVFVVPSLDADASAIELFRERSTAVGGTGDQADDADVAQLCRRLDGLPLAIELAAARTRTLTPADLLARIDADLGVLDGGRGRPERHRTLLAAVAWSHDLLEPDEQAVFRRLSVFPGAFDLRAAETIAGDDRLTPSWVDDLLDRLVRQSMLGAEATPAGVRFRLLAAMRELGAAELVDAGETESTFGRHTAWCLEEIERIGRQLAGPAEVDGVLALQERWADLRAAVDRACRADDAPLARRLIEPVANEVFLRSRSEIGDWAERILAIADGDEDLVTFGLMWAARRDLRHRDAEGFEELVRRYGAPDNPLVRHARALVVEDHQQLVGRCEEAARYLRERGHDYLADVHEIGIGRALLALGRVEEHDELVRDLVERFRRNGPPTFLLWTLGMLGYSALRQGRHAVADELFRESMTVEVPPGTHSRTRPVRARLAARTGDRARAFRILRDHASDLLERADLYESRLLCLDVVNLLVGADRGADAARLLGYVDGTGLLENPAFAAIVHDSAKAIERSVPDHDHLRTEGRRLDDRAALALVRTVAGELAEPPPTP